MIPAKQKKEQQTFYHQPHIEEKRDSEFLTYLTKDLEG